MPSVRVERTTSSRCSATRASRIYRALKTDLDRLLPKSKAKRQLLSSREGTAARSLRALRDRFTAIERIDYFDAPARSDAAASLDALEQAVHGRRLASGEVPQPLIPAGFHARRWVTRHRPGVDRMASAWLIRRFIDPNATFAFSDHPSGADVPFDMYTGEFSHHGELCTFEVLAARFLLKSSAIAKVSQIVHDLDMKDTKYDPPEAAAVGRMVEGLRALHADDAALLEQGIGMFDALASSFQSDDKAARAPKVALVPGARKSTAEHPARTRTRERDDDDKRESSGHTRLQHQPVHRHANPHGPVNAAGELERDLIRPRFDGPATRQLRLGEAGVGGDGTLSARDITGAAAAVAGASCHAQAVRDTANSETRAQAWPQGRRPRRCTYRSCEGGWR